MNNNSKNSLNGGWFYDGADGLSVINPRFLMKTFGNKSGFKVINGAVGFLFNMKNSFTTHRISS